MNHPAALALTLALLASGCDPGAEALPDASPPPDATACDPAPALDDDGAPSGYLSCGDGHFDRVEGVACPPNIPGETYAPCRPGDVGACAVDADCGTVGDARCVHLNGECLCQTFCQTDADCGDDEACICRVSLPNSPFGGRWTLSLTSVCQRAACRTGDDCGGFACGMAASDCGGGPLACRTADDDCRQNSDCGDRAWCVYDPDESRWRCLPGGVACE